MMKVALTGGIGSGKSLVADYFASLGVPIIDADRIARELLTKNQVVINSVMAHFEGISERPGVIDRRRLRTLIFGDEVAKRWLEQQLHPYILDKIKKQAAELSSAYYIAVIPLLIETGLQRLFDTVIVVDLPEAIQRQRLQARDSLSNEEVDIAFANQASRAERNYYANIVIDNSHSLANTKRQVEQINQQLLEKY